MMAGRGLPRGDVQHQRAARLEVAHQPFAPENRLRGGGGDEQLAVRRGRQAGGRFGQAVEVGIAKQHAQGQMPRSQAADLAQHGLRGHVVDHLGEEHDQRPLAQPLAQLREGAFEVGLDEVGVDVVHRVRDALGGPPPAGRGQIGAHLRVERHQAQLIAGARRDVGQHQHGVERVVELREPGALGGHEPPAVEQADDRLVALLLVLADDQAAPPRGRLPVDVAVFVVAPVLAQPLELVLAAAQAHRPHQEIFPALAGEQLVRAHGGDVRVHLQRVARRQPELPLPQPQRGRVADVVIAQLDRPAA